MVYLLLELVRFGELMAYSLRGQGDKERLYVGKRSAQELVYLAGGSKRLEMRLELAVDERGSAQFGIHLLDKVHDVHARPVARGLHRDDDAVRGPRQI